MAEKFNNNNSYENFDPFDSDFERDIESADPQPIYEETQQQQQQQQHRGHSYDEVSIDQQRGRPVLDNLTSVRFESPLKAPPIPAPRPSIQQQQQQPKQQPQQQVYETHTNFPLKEQLQCHDLDNEQQQVCDDVSDEQQQQQHPLYEELDECKAENIYSEVPNPPPKNNNNNNNKDDGSLLDSEVPEDEVKGQDGGFLSRRSKLTTIDIRKDVNLLWEEAVKELDRDESLVQFIEKKEEEQQQQQQQQQRRNSHLQRQISKNSYDSVAIPEQRFKIVDGVQVPIPVTLLKNFDPYFEVENRSESSSGSTSRSSSPTTAATTTETDSSVNDLPPPKHPPPKHGYENVWIPPDSTTPVLESDKIGKRIFHLRVYSKVPI